MSDADTKRLNWLQAHTEGLRRGSDDWIVVLDTIESEGEFYVSGKSVRKAIDAAMVEAGVSKSLRT